MKFTVNISPHKVNMKFIYNIYNLMVKTNFIQKDMMNAATLVKVKSDQVIYNVC